MIHLYNDIKTIIEANVPEIRHVDLFRNQFVYLENGGNQMNPFPFPCLFVSFEDGINYDRNLGGVLNGKINVKIYIGFSKLTEAFSVLNSLFSKVSGNLHNMSGSNYDNLVKTSEKYDQNHSNIYVWQMDFEANYRDTSYIDVKYGKDIEVNPVTPEILGEWQ